jgi:hypothetical protein
VPGSLEDYAARFDDPFGGLAQRRVPGVPGRLLAPRDRNKTLTALAGAEPVTGAQHPAVQRLQFFSARYPRLRVLSVITTEARRMARLSERANGRRPCPANPG